jgi:hypothetical protein
MGHKSRDTEIIIATGTEINIRTEVEGDKIYSETGRYNFITDTD